MTMLPIIRQSILTVSSPIIPLIGKVSLPLPRLMGEYDAKSFMASSPPPGTALVSRKRGQLSNGFIPGWWKHGAMYVGLIYGVPMIVESIWPFVRMVPVKRWFEGEDYALATLPTFMTHSQMSRSAEKILSLLGLSYDVRMSLTAEEVTGHSAFYCEEVIWWSISEVFKEDGKISPYEPRPTWGVMTVTAQDRVNASDKWRTSWESSTLSCAFR